MGNKYVHDLDELDDISDFDVMLIDDLDSPYATKKVKVSTLKGIFGADIPDTDDYAEDDTADNPDWSVEGIAGGWRVKITSIVTGARHYIIERRNDETGNYDVVGSLPFVLQFQGSQKVIHLDFFANDSTIREFATFRVSTCFTDETISTATTAQTAWSLRAVLPTWTPSAPTLISAGGFPETIQTKDLKFLVRIKIQAPTDERHFIKGYEIRVYDGTLPSTWNSPAKTFKREVDAGNGPKIVFFEIERSHWDYDADLKIQVRAIAIDPSGLSGDWSTAQTVDTSADVTAPDTPVLLYALVASAFNILVQFAPPSRGNGCLDFSHYVMQYRIDGGAATLVPTDGNGVWKENAYYWYSTQAQAGVNEVEFRAKAVDYAGNESAYCSWSTAVTPDQVATTGIADDAVTAAKVGEVALFGWQYAGAFSATDHNTVAWTEAAITLTDGTSYSIVAGNTGNISALTYIYLDINTSITVLQTTTTPATAIGAGKILIGVAKDVASGKDAEYQAFGGPGGKLTLITADNIAANTITANEIFANTITTGELNFTPLISSGATGAVIATINASAEGINIEADNIAISGDVTFSSGYDPTDKYDLSGNDADDIGEGTTYGKMPKAWKHTSDVTKIDGGIIYTNTIVTGSIATNTITAGNINTTAGITGTRIKIDSNVVFDSDVQIQGLLMAAGGLKTDSGTTRLELGRFSGASDSLNFYHTNILVGYFYMTSAGQTYIRCGRKADAAVTYVDYDTVSLYDASLDQKVQLRNDGTIYINEVKVVSAQQAHIIDATGAAGDPPTQAEFNALVGKFNTALSQLETFGVFAAA